MADFLSDMTLLEKLSENVSYYSLNSNFNDPMYQYAHKAYSDLYSKIYKNFWIGNLSYAEYSVVDRSEILEYGTIPCFTSEKQAFVDSHLSCFLFQLPFFLERIQFGYISLLLVIPIIAISIFGGIKESYRWYLLNQAIWDALICYDFICQKPTLIGWFWPNKWESTNTCIYNRLTPDSLIGTSVTTIIRDVFRFSTYIPVVLLAFSRFLGIYFPTFYQKVFSKSWKTIAFILIFNFVCILFICSRKIIFIMLTSNVGNGMFKCMEKFCPDAFINSTISTKCYQNDEKFFQCLNGISPPMWIFSINNNKINHIFALSIFCASNVFAFLLLIKIVSQLRFQLKSKKRSSFFSMAKIVGVIGFQCFTMSIIFVVNFIQFDLFSQAVPNSTIKLYNFKIYKQLPTWLFFLQYISTTLSFNIIRVFLDSLIVLTVLSGYSGHMKKTAKFLVLCLIQPKISLEKIKYKMKFGKRNQKTVIIVSSINKVS